MLLFQHRKTHLSSLWYITLDFIFILSFDFVKFSIPYKKSIDWSVLVNKVIYRLLRSKAKDVRDEWQKLHDEELDTHHQILHL